MNINKEKQYLVIKNVYCNNFFKEYLEKLCQDEHVKIVEEYINSFSFMNNTPSIYSKFEASPGFDVILWSYNKEKLDYINYLYNNFKKRFLHASETVSNIIKEKTEGNNLNNKELESNFNEEYSTCKLDAWSKIDANIHMKKPTFKQIILHKYSEEIKLYSGVIFAASNIIILLALTLKYFMVK